MSLEERVALGIPRELREMLDKLAERWVAAARDEIRQQMGMRTLGRRFAVHRNALEDFDAAERRAHDALGGRRRAASVGAEGAR
jgi:hypothetical protein